MAPSVTPIEQRFHAKYIRGNVDECWLWNGSTDNSGYGRIRAYKGEHFGAHILAWMIAHNQTERPTLKVLHRCDNPSCVNPAHLFLGTLSDNMQDMIGKGRSYGQQLTHCKYGHEYTPENTYRAPGSNGRSCKMCRAIKSAQFYHSKVGH